MKLTNDIVNLYNFDLDVCISEFKQGFNDITKSKYPHGIHTFIISSYDDFKVTTELVYCSVYDKTVIFYVSQATLQLNIGYKKKDTTEEDSGDAQSEPEFEILGGEILPIGSSIFDILGNETKSDVYYIGRYNKNSDIMGLSKELIDSNMYELNSLKLNDELRMSVLKRTHPDINLVCTHEIGGTYYDVYSVPANSSFKINQIDGVDDSINDRDIELMIVTSHPDILYLGDCCNDRGFFYNMYTLNKSDELKVAKHLIENELNDISNLLVNEADLVNNSIDFFNERINQYKSDIVLAIEKEEPPMNIDENPLANGFFDNVRENRPNKPLNVPRRLGE